MSKAKEQPDFITPGGFLAAALHRLPVLVWAIGVGGIVTIGVIIGFWKPSPTVAIFGSLGLFVGMFGLFIFSALVTPSRIAKPPMVSLFVLWAFSFLLVASGFLAASSVFFDFPVPLRTMLFLQKSSSIKESGPSHEPRQTSNDSLPKLYLLAVGINDYGHPASNRHSAIASANAIAGLFAKQQHIAFSDVESVVITESDATQANVLRALRGWARTARSKDLAVAFFAGNSGVWPTESIPGRYAFMCFDSDYNEPERTGISGKTILDLSANIACPKLVLIDTPTYGGIFPQEARDATPRTEVQRLPPLTIMTASWSGGTPETSFGQSMFSKNLIDALEMAADKNQDNVVTVSELWDYVVANVSDATAATPPQFREINPKTVLVRNAS